MKNWQKKVLAVVLAVALIVTGFATSTFMDGNSNKVVKETTVSKTNDNKSDVAKADIVSNKDTKTEKSKEPNVSENKNNVDNKIEETRTRRLTIRRLSVRLRTKITEKP